MDKEHIDSEQQLLVGRKLDIIGQLAGGISHNFNNQLTGIMGFANLISMRSTDENIKKFAKEIIGICKNAGDMVRELLTFARYKPMSTANIDVHNSIATVTHLLSSSIDKRIVIEHKFNAKRCVVMADAVQFQSVLFNLALNSRDAMPRGGTITFSTQCVDDPSAVPSGSIIKIEVSDTGNGFDDEVKARLFEPFFTTKGQGHIGLGLSAVYEFVKSANGTIEVRSEEGKGTSVTLVLPNHTPQEKKDYAAASENSAADNAQKQKSGTILLVDDDKGIRDSIYAFLKGIGYSVITARDGLDAVEKYELAHDNINLVITDMVMPHMCGKDAFIKMKEINPAVKAIGITGFTKYNEDDMKTLGIKRILHKPFAFEELQNAIEEYI